jgi:hypothetical protein
MRMVPLQGRRRYPEGDLTVLCTTAEFEEGLITKGLIMKRILGLGLSAIALCACGVSPDGASSGENLATSDQSIVGGTGKTETGRPYVVMLYGLRIGGGISRCTGTYFAPRVVLTAASCLPNSLYALYVYYGKNFDVDVAQVPNIPAPGQTSVWSRADSWEAHPSYNATLLDANLAAVYLDRKLPFDPLPLARFNIDSSYNNKPTQIVGWGANQVFDPNLTQVSGIGVERSGTMKIVGTPTAADYDPNDPNPGLLNATVRSHLIKLIVQNATTSKPYGDGNGCAADGGGPMIINKFGQDYIAGVMFWTGLSCLNYQMLTRIDPYLPFLDLAYMRGGQATLIPRAECVSQEPNGVLRANFSYNNGNGVNVTVPYGSSNALAIDTKNTRPSLFIHGDHSWAFSVNFNSNQSIDYRLSPTNSPTTQIHVDSRSPRCAANDLHVSCERFCRPMLAVATCPSVFQRSTQDQCIATCLQNYSFAADVGCSGEWAAYVACASGISSDPANWQCFSGSADPFLSDSVCVDQTTALNTCFGF